MGIKKFIYKVTTTLGLTGFKINGKKKAIKNLLKKLKERRLNLYKSVKKELSEDQKEELDIITLQIDKGKKLLNKLNSKE